MLSVISIPSESPPYACGNQRESVVVGKSQHRCNLRRTQTGFR